MKSILLTLSLLLLITQQITVSHDFEPSQKVGSKKIGVSRNWQQAGRNKFFVDVDITKMNFPDISYLPYVYTFLGCDDGCVDVTGVHSYINLSTKGFRVYITKLDPSS